MKKDIYIPPSNGISLAIVPSEENIWDLYLINQNEHSIQNILVVTEASSEDKLSSKLRYFLESLTPISFIKFETVYGEVAFLRNVVSISYYIGMDIYEKEFSFTLSDLNMSTELPLISKMGYLID